MDEYIAYVAANEREAARLHLSWQLDLLRLHVGLVEVVTPDDGPIYRNLRHKRDIEGHVISHPLTTPEPPVRFVPVRPGWGVLVRDVEG